MKKPMLPQVGQVAPNFALSDQNGVEHTLKQYLGKWVILYFYPKDDTPGCTKEACNFRDNFSALKKEGMVVLGVSCDSIQKHAKFVEKYTLPFTLLSDEEKKVVEMYGVWVKKKFMGREYMGINRTTFLIDSKGIIVHLYENVKPSDHAEEIMTDMFKKAL